MEIARSRLPGNSWLQGRLKSNMNINYSCNAYWNGSINFYRSSSTCRNTGEIAAIFDHEWGHGKDKPLSYDKLLFSSLLSNTVDCFVTGMDRNDVTGGKCRFR